MGLGDFRFQPIGLPGAERVGALSAPFFFRLGYFQSVVVMQLRFFGPALSTCWTPCRKNPCHQAGWNRTQDIKSWGKDGFWQTPSVLQVSMTSRNHQTRWSRPGYFLSNTGYGRDFL